MNTCVMNTTVQCRAVQVFLACHSVFYTEPCENSCMSFFKIRTSKKMLAAQELGRQQAKEFELHFPWLPGATNLAMNHRQAGGQEQYKW